MCLHRKVQNMRKNRRPFKIYHTLGGEIQHSVKIMRKHKIFNLYSGLVLQKF